LIQKYVEHVFLMKTRLCLFTEPELQTSKYVQNGAVVCRNALESSSQAYLLSLHMWMYIYIYIYISADPCSAWEIRKATRR